MRFLTDPACFSLSEFREKERRKLSRMVGKIDIRSRRRISSGISKGIYIRMHIPLSGNVNNSTGISLV